MNFKEFFLLREAHSNTAAIVVDIQPLYHKNCKHIMPKFVKFINNYTGTIICFYNGPDIGGDEEYTVKEYFLDNGIEEEKIDSIIFKEKVYAFFRNWMDAGISRKHIIQAIRYMVINKQWDSRDITEEEWQKIYGNDWPELKETIINDDMINIPDINISFLKQHSGCYLMGGGEEECLSEFRLLLEAFNIKYKLISELIY